MQREYDARMQQSVTRATLQTFFGYWRIWVREQKLEWEREVMARWQRNYTLMRRGVRRWLRSAAEQKKERRLTIAALRCYARHLYRASLSALALNARWCRSIRFWSARNVGVTTADRIEYSLHRTARFPVRPLACVIILQQMFRARRRQRQAATAIVALEPLAVALRDGAWLVHAWQRWRDFCTYRRCAELKEQARQDAVRTAELERQVAAEHEAAAAAAAEAAQQAAEKAAAVAAQEETLALEELEKQRRMARMAQIEQQLEQERALRDEARSVKAGAELAQAEAAEVLRQDEQEIAAMLEARQLALQRLQVAQNREAELIEEMKTQTLALNREYSEEVVRLDELQEARHQNPFLTAALEGHDSSVDLSGTTSERTDIDTSLATSDDDSAPDSTRSELEAAQQAKITAEQERLFEEEQYRTSASQPDTPTATPGMSDRESAVKLIQSAWRRRTPAASNIGDMLDDEIKLQMADDFRRYVLCATSFAWWKAQVQQKPAEVTGPASNDADEHQENHAAAPAGSSTDMLEAQTVDSSRPSEPPPLLPTHEGVPVNLVRLERLLHTLADLPSEQTDTQQPGSDGGEKSEPHSVDNNAGGTHDLAGTDDNNSGEQHRVEEQDEDEELSPQLAQVADEHLSKWKSRQLLRRWHEATVRTLKRVRDYRIGARLNEELRRGLAHKALRSWRSRTRERVLSHERLELAEAHWMTRRARVVVRRLREYAARRIQRRFEWHRVQEKTKKHRMQSLFFTWRTNAQARSKQRQARHKKLAAIFEETKQRKLRWSFNAWCDWHHHRLVLQVNRERAMRHFNHHVLAKAFGAIVRFVVVSKANRAQWDAAISHHRRTTCRKFTSVWVQWVNDQYLLRQRLAEARAWHRHRVLANTIATWKSWVACQKQQEWRRQKALGCVLTTASLLPAFLLRHSAFV